MSVTSEQDLDSKHSLTGTNTRTHTVTVGWKPVLLVWNVSVRVFLKESEFLLGELGSVLRRDVAQRDTELVLFVFSRQLARKQMGVHVRAATDVHHQSGYFYSKRKKRAEEVTFCWQAQFFKDICPKKSNKYCKINRLSHFWQFPDDLTVLALTCTNIDTQRLPRTQVLIITASLMDPLWLKSMPQWLWLLTCMCSRSILTDC